MAVWTQEDVDRLKALIASNVKSIRYEGPPGRSIEYHDLSQARVLLAEMIADVAGDDFTPYKLVQTNKGFF